MKKCTSEERETCNVEKMGCKGCYYNELSDEEIIKDLEKRYEVYGKRK